MIVRHCNSTGAKYNVADFRRSIICNDFDISSYSAVIYRIFQ